MKNLYILGLNAYHGDSSACLMLNGQVICAFEEERFTRKKHWAGFPTASIKNCLSEAKITIYDIDHITISRDPKHNLFKKIIYSIRNPRLLFNSLNRITNSYKIATLETEFQKHFNLSKLQFQSKIKYIEHHSSHLASAFFASPYDESAILSIDAFGDFSSTVLAYGKGNKITKLEEVNFPHSIGQFYTACTQYLGFHYYGDEYKVMGLAPYGNPKYLDKFSEILIIENDGLFRLNLDYFTHHIDGVQTQIMENNDPTPSLFFSIAFEKLLGPARKPNEELTQYHKDLASSIQKHCENVIFHLLNRLHKKTGSINISIAGGCAQNSVANGKISSNTNFKYIYIPPAGHDAGTSIGSALYLYNHVLGYDKMPPMLNPYLGSYSKNDEIEILLKEQGVSYNYYNDNELTKVVAKYLYDGKVVGWFQGRAEFGPRALGGRSILVDPRREDAKDLLNSKIKRRESFRPFAPSILKEKVADYFEIIDEVPFMEKVFPIKLDKQNLIKAVTHVDGSGRLQTVDKNVSPKYYKLIEEFNILSGVPILLNTSFNENEPIVNLPIEALNCYLRTSMDVLVLENFVINRIP
jgi:carbamoyltransferase